MLRRLVCVLVCLLIFVPMGAQASLSEVPTREKFSLAYDRLETAIDRSRPIAWNVKVTPTAVNGYIDGALEAMVSLISSMELSGMVQKYDDSGCFEVTLLSDQKEIGSLGHMSGEERTGVRFGDDWLSISNHMQTEAITMLSLDDLGCMLLSPDYATLLSGDVPFLSAVYREGMAIWSLASPYSEDSNRLSVPSGATGHGVTYEIDTSGLRQMASSWADSLKNEGYSIGISGTPLSYGFSDATFDAFVERVRSFGQSVEVTSPIKFSTTFGEGDLLRTAKGSGTISTNGKRAGISYSYTCSPSSTRITRKYSIKFEPVGYDSLHLTCTWLTSSNGSSSGAQEFAINASGTFDGQPYKLKLNVNFVNRYDVLEDSVLQENITGTMTGSLQYAGQTVFDLSVKREGQTLSKAGLTTAIEIQEGLDIVLKNHEKTLFAGLVSLSMQVDEGPGEKPELLEAAIPLESMDFMDIDRLRATSGNLLAATQQRLIQALPLNAMNALADTY